MCLDIPNLCPQEEGNSYFGFRQLDQGHFGHLEQEKSLRSIGFVGEFALQRNLVYYSEHYVNIHNICVYLYYLFNGSSKFKKMGRKRKANIIVVFGAYPDIGKGIFVASLAYLLREKGVNSAPLKFDGYLNFNSGAMNPYHISMNYAYYEEEVFVLKDGFEGDADSGYYERFTAEEYTKASNLTNGQIFFDILNKERKGWYPKGEILKLLHVRKEVESWLLSNAERRDCLVLEVGGTIGDPENKVIFEALSALQEANKSNVLTIMLSPYFSTSKNGNNSFELSSRTKMARMKYKESWRLGLKPHLVVLRISSGQKLFTGDLNYLASDCELPTRQFLLDPDCESIYQLPQILLKQKLVDYIEKYFNLTVKKRLTTKRLEQYAKKWLFFRESSSRQVQVAIFGKTPSWDSYVSLRETVEHACVSLGKFPKIVWIDDAKDNEQRIKELLDSDCLIVGEDTHFFAEKLEALRLARIKKIPTLAISFGADIAISECLQNVGKIRVNHPEIKQKGQKKGINIFIKRDNLILGSYPVFPRKFSFVGQDFLFSGSERFRTLTLIDPKSVGVIKKSGLELLLSSKQLGPVAWGLPDHPFFIAAKFKPEFKSHPGSPHELFKKLIMAINRSNK